MSKGKLYVVALPIGNLQDVTLRALEILRAVKYIVAEDTREIGNFLAAHAIPKPQYISYREQNHLQIVEGILDKLAEGEDMALVTDRGTPTISDPGFRLVKDAADATIEIVTIPGPSSVIAALAISGLPTDRFSFLGFLPRKPGKQKQLLQEFGNLPATFIILESPFRLVKLLHTIHDALGDIDIALAHELTKLNEGVIRGKLKQVIADLGDKPVKGEWVVMGRVSAENEELDA